jgi:hypothetical protein
MRNFVQTNMGRSLTTLPYIVDLVKTDLVTFVQGFIYDDFILNAEALEWLQNLDGNWSYDVLNGKSVSFEKEQDALLFKLIWC